MNRVSDKNPLVSIILPVYNGGKYLEKCLESIMAQTYQNWELIIINDGSVDDSEKIILNYAAAFEAKLRYERLNKNRGIADCLNLGIAISRGTFIARIDADDLMLAHRIEKQVDFLNANSHVGVLGSAAIEIDENERETGIFEVVLGHLNIKKSLIRSNSPLLHPTIMLRKEVLTTTPVYRNLYPISQDHDLWLRLLQTVIFENIEEPLIKRRIHAKQITHSKRGHYDVLSMKIAYFRANKIFLRNGIFLFKSMIIVMLPNFIFVGLKRLKRNARKLNRR